VDELQLSGLLTKPVSHSTMFDTIMEAFGKDVKRKPANQLIEAKHKEKLNERKGARILLVEDNDINQQVAAELIESAGFIVEIANNGLEALNRLNKKADFELVFMDLQMPVMDGITASEKIRKNKELDHIPIIAMTADVVGEIKEKCMKIGMNEFIPKPISTESVFEAIIQWIKPGKRDIATLKEKTEDIESQSIDIPKLEGLDIQDGLNRVNNNKKLYQSLLFKFHDNNINLADQIKEACKKGNDETALRLVHTVKGVSGNIGAKDLNLTTIEFERKLIEKDYTGLNEIIDDYTQSLNLVLHSIAAYKSSQSSVNQEANKDNNGTELNEELFTKLFDRLTASLEENNTEAFVIVEEFLKLSGLGDYRKQFAEIENLVKNYNFDRALEILIELRFRHKKGINS
jgi:CheY-like chemotaxis protein/HPt (histidine-containing phosphotransfer) domain-containing protein